MQPLRSSQPVIFVVFVALVSLLWLIPVPPSAAALQPPKEVYSLTSLSAPPETICDFSTARFALRVSDKKNGMRVAGTTVTMNVIPAGEIILRNTDAAGEVEFDYKPPGVGEIKFLFLASDSHGISNSLLFTVKVEYCIVKLNLNYRGTYQFNLGGATATLSLLALVDDGEMRLGADGKYGGKTEVFFSEQMSAQILDCVATYGPAEVTGRLDMEGALAEDTVAVSLTFQSFPVSWLITGTCPEEEASVSFFSPPGNVDLGFLGVNNFTVAAAGGSVTRAVPMSGPWSGEGTVTVIVYPEKQKSGTASVPNASIAYERNE